MFRLVFFSENIAWQKSLLSLESHRAPQHSSSRQPEDTTVQAAIFRLNFGTLHILWEHLLRSSVDSWEPIEKHHSACYWEKLAVTAHVFKAGGGYSSHSCGVIHAREYQTIKGGISSVSAYWFGKLRLPQWYTLGSGKLLLLLHLQLQRRLSAMEDEAAKAHPVVALWSSPAFPHRHQFCGQQRPKKYHILKHCS